MLNRIKLSIALLLFTGCNTVKTVYTNDKQKVGIKTNAFKGTIFSEHYPLAKFYSHASNPTTLFTPSTEDILLAEHILKQQLVNSDGKQEKHLDIKHYLKKNLRKYFRQYIGFINEKGNRVIHINFYWNQYTLFDRVKGYSDERVQYNSDFAIVQDGGSRYWNINVDLVERQLYNLQVNSVA